MYKLAAIIGGVLLMAAVALAGTLTSLDSRGSAGGDRPGTGLGLAIVETLARRWRGTASLANRAGGGMRAEVRFPAAATVKEEPWVEAHS
jgi:sensor histidine kinase regulating citrate/malate metabolism